MRELAAELLSIAKSMVAEKLPKSVYDKSGMFGWSSPANKSKPWRVARKEKVLKHLKSISSEKDIVVDYHSRDGGYETMWVGLSDNRDSDATQKRIEKLAKLLKSKGYKVEVGRNDIILKDDIKRDAIRNAKSMVARLSLGPGKVETRATDVLRRSKLKARNKGDMQTAVLSAGYYAKKLNETMYMYKGNSYMNVVWLVSKKASDYLDPINNIGGVIYSVTPDLEVSKHEVKGRKTAGKATGQYSDSDGDMHVVLYFSEDGDSAEASVDTGNHPKRQKVTERELKYILKNRPFDKRKVDEYAETYYSMVK